MPTSWTSAGTCGSRATACRARSTYRSATRQEQRGPDVRLTAEREIVGKYVDIGIDHFESVGFEISDPGFETGDGWELSPTRGPILPAIDIFVPERPERIFRAVAAAFRR